MLELAYVVSFFAEGDFEGGPAIRPVFFVNAETGGILHRFDNLQTANGTGPGGNTKIGQYQFGQGLWPAFEVAQTGTTCAMRTSNVVTKDMNSSTSEPVSAFSYPCFNNTVRLANGAYSPLNDGHSFGGFLYRAYVEWYARRPLTQQLLVRMHYGSAYQNAFWNGTSMTFGDGASTFFPLGSMDVMGHEVSHGFTEQNSGLIYSGQSGGINEAYSDMAGEMLETWAAATYGSLLPRAMPDFMVGADIFKGNGALRNMCSPALPSIDHISKYTNGMDVHYSSGVFNKVFCQLSKTSGWGPRKAFEIFLLANANYWTPSTTFQLGAEGVLRAAQAKGYDSAGVVAAFGTVGITLGGSPVPGGSYAFNTLRVITDSSPRGCSLSNWQCMTNLCKADIGTNASRNWAGCWQNGAKWQCYFECTGPRQLQ
jgi:Zn-dependent metalloprotease